MSTDSTVSPLRQRMIEDMAARKLGRHTQRSHIHSCRRFAAFLGRSPEEATADDVRRFQLHLVEAGLSIPNRNRIMTGVKFLFRVTLRRHDLAAEIYHLKEPQKLPLTMSPNEAERLLDMAVSLRDRVMLSLGYGCGLRAGEIVRLKDGDIDSAQMIIRIVQSKGRKDRHVMLPPELLLSLREWWKVRPTRFDAGVPAGERWLFPGRRQGLHLTYRQLSRIFDESAAAAGITKRISLRSLRHSFATDLLEKGSTFVISRLCSDIPSWIRRRATRAWPQAASPPSRARSRGLAARTSGRGRSVSPDRRHSPPPAWAAQLWRSRISSATTAPLGVRPTAGT
jgi:site-specific recombinase XerD